MQRGEHMGRGVRDGGDPVGGEEPLPGAPGAQRKHDHHRRTECRDDGFQNGIRRDSIKHGCPSRLKVRPPIILSSRSSVRDAGTCRHRRTQSTSELLPLRIRLECARERGLHAADDAAFRGPGRTLRSRRDRRLRALACRPLERHHPCRRNGAAGRMRSGRCIPELEHAHPLGHGVGLLLKRLCGRRVLFDQGRVLLRHLVHLRQRRVDLVDPRRLLRARSRDLRHDLRNLLDRRHDLAQRRPRLVHQVDTLLHLAGAVGDQVLDVLGGLRGALGEAAHLRCDHGEAASGLAGTRGLDRGVERQQVGLPRDLVDHADDVGDLARGFLDPRHRAHRLRHHRAAAVGDLARAGGKGIGLLGVLRVLLHRR